MRWLLRNLGRYSLLLAVFGLSIPTPAGQPQDIEDIGDSGWGVEPPSGFERDPESGVSWVKSWRLGREEHKIYLSAWVSSFGCPDYTVATERHGPKPFILQGGRAGPDSYWGRCVTKNNYKRQAGDSFVFGCPTDFLALDFDHFGAAPWKWKVPGNPNGLYLLLWYYYPNAADRDFGLKTFEEFKQSLHQSPHPRVKKRTREPAAAPAQEDEGFDPAQAPALRLLR